MPPRNKTTTKKELINRIAETTSLHQTTVKKTVQCFLDHVLEELGRGNRIEFRDFGVFEIHQRAPRVAHNPRTMEQIPVPAKRTVKFKIGRLMKESVEGNGKSKRAASKPKSGESKTGRKRATARSRRS